MKEEREIPAYDPWDSYQIKSHNKSYNGDANGIRFVDGVGVVNALDKDADADEMQERLDQLMWFWNANPLLKKVATDPSDPDSPQEWRTYPAYLIEPYTSNMRAKRTSKREPELAGAKGGS